MKSLHLILILVFFAACSKTIDNTGTCSDGILNQGEQQIDCGGPCPALCESCADGIMNQGEQAVDCGGPCDPCYPRMSAELDTSEWFATSRNAFIYAPGCIRIYGTNQQRNITLYYSGPFAAGTGSGSQFSGELRDENGIVYASSGDGTITFSTFDTTLKIISGIYSFSATDTVSGTSIEVSNGVFNVLQY
jgi:hypothetical protein